MAHHSAPILDRAMASRGGCGCFADAIPMPMGCATCGHAPYAHGCPGRSADHDYVQPDDALMRMRLQARRRLSLNRPLPVFEPPIDVAPAEIIPLAPAQHRPEQPSNAPASPAVPAPLPKRTPRPVRRPAPPFRTAATAPPRREDGRRPAPRGKPPAVDGPRETKTATPTRRPHTPYGAPQNLLPPPAKRARPTLPTSGRALDRTMEVRPMHDGRSTTPPSARPASATPVIPGWQVFLSDRGRFWASRREPFSPEAFHAGAERTVDADTFEQLQAETARQEETAAAQAVRS